ncbi:hypothetical protein A7K73_06005 [Candidatus Methylacidiphilum fumarolicum]|uniref:Uncharacterized protein n=2 Tax=Candidatus Methylacidiphilum fumarolicum TaxID=591154 RepID=I0JX13_METFB|nr:hypothetical protein [Candidatus Methylacidiphilum fumarolicum]TFE69472.1 hypothetical protein A7K73_06005 [Candidatus Methylacidiphilum fumarolicum]TFE77132.1 hypothetical protein A7D33_06065 [Candidatus Methylacidiphilum fumarolicum]CAI9085412.1 conserved protein of unknown function [Candidatus Methylacidiphilum fumarolicum]CCG91782.1 hypothetical protein MFUM_210021 [Methylacidiphilum fumariolicum SolV]
MPKDHCLRYAAEKDRFLVSFSGLNCFAESLGKRGKRDKLVTEGRTFEEKERQYIFLMSHEGGKRVVIPLSVNLKLQDMICPV